MAHGLKWAAPERQRVGHEQHVEQTALGELGEVDDSPDVDIEIGMSVRMAPSRHVLATAGPIEHAELHVSR